MNSTHKLRRDVLGRGNLHFFVPEGYNVSTIGVFHDQYSTPRPLVSKLNCLLGKTINLIYMKLVEMTVRVAINDTSRL